MASIYQQNLTQPQGISLRELAYGTAVIGGITELFRRTVADTLVNYALNQPNAIGLNIENYDFCSVFQTICSYTVSLSVAGLVMRVANTAFQFNSIALYATCAVSAAVTLLAVARFAFEKTRAPDAPTTLPSKTLTENLDQVLANYIAKPEEKALVIDQQFIIITNPNLRKISGEAWKERVPARLLFFFLISSDNKAEALAWYKKNKAAMKAKSELFSSTGKENIMIGFLEREQFEKMIVKDISTILI